MEYVHIYIKPNGHININPDKDNIVRKNGISVWDNDVNIFFCNAHYNFLHIFAVDTKEFSEIENRDVDNRPFFRSLINFNDKLHLITIDNQSGNDYHYQVHKYENWRCLRYYSKKIVDFPAACVMTHWFGECRAATMNKKSLFVIHAAGILKYNYCNARSKNNPLFLEKAFPTNETIIQSLIFDDMLVVITSKTLIFYNSYTLAEKYIMKYPKNILYACLNAKYLFILCEIDKKRLNEKDIENNVSLAICIYNLHGLSREHSLPKNLIAKIKINNTSKRKNDVYQSYLMAASNKCLIISNDSDILDVFEL